MTVSRAIVTGGTGFIGAHVARALDEAGVAITMLVRPSSDRARLRSLLGARLDRVRFVDVSLAAPLAVRDAVVSARPDVVLHLAGDARPRASVDDEPAMEALHVEGTRAVVEAAIAAGAARLVALGTSDVYGLLPSPHDAAGPLDPRTPYARTKARADALALRLGALGGLAVTVLRPYHVYGPLQSPRGLIPSVTDACADDRALPMSDGEQTRDFVHVDDIARAVLLAAGGDGSGVIDVCTGVATSVASVARAIASRFPGLARGPVLGAVARGSFEPQANLGDPAPALRAIGFRARVGLDEGLARTVDARLRERAAAAS